jgi:hypothetical protein
MNAEWKTRKIQIAWMPMRRGQNFGNNPGNGQPGTNIGKRIFPDLLVPPDQLPPNDERGAYARAKVVVTVYDQPNKNLTVYLRLFDPDDPSSKTSPIDANDDDLFFETCRPGDNRGLSGFQGQGLAQSDERGRISDIDVPVTTNAQGVGRAFVTVLLPRQPGDKLKVAAALEQWVRDAMYVGQGSQEDALRVWVSSLGSDWKVPEGNEPDTNPPARATELLTIWRRLYVEVDSMGSEPQGQQFAPDDTFRGDIPDPPLHVLRVAMRETYVEVLYSAHSEPDTWWKYNFDLATPILTEGEDWKYCITGLQNHAPTRGSRNEEAIDYWVVYVVGVYEIGEGVGRGIGNDQDPIPDDMDNDPDDEFNIPGTTNPTEPECSLIGYEQIRDAAAQHGVDLNLYYAIVTAHEIGHQLLNPNIDPRFHHTKTLEPQDLMWVPYDDASEVLAVQTPRSWRWRPDHIVVIRGLKKP